MRLFASAISTKFLAFTGLLVLMPSLANADIFVGVEEVEGNTNIQIVGLDAPVPEEANVDNNNIVGVSPNTVAITLEVYAFNQNDLVFTPSFTAGTTEYTATTTLINNTEVAWRGFSLEIGEGGFDGTTDTFAIHAANDDTFTNFDYPDEDSPFVSPEFSTAVIASNRIEFSGGLVNPGETTSFQFQVDVPTNQPLVTFRGSVNAVPEPSTLAALSLGTGLIGIAIWRKRRRSPRDR